MNGSSQHRRDARASADSDGERMLAGLLDILAQQVRLAKSGESEKAAALTDEAERLLDGISRLAVPADRATGRRICRLYDELCLTFATEKSQLAEKLTRLRKGKKSLRVYRDALVRKV